MAQFIEIDHYDSLGNGKYTDKISKITINIEQILYVHEDTTGKLCFIRFGFAVLIKAPYKKDDFLKLIP